MRFAIYSGSSGAWPVTPWLDLMNELFGSNLVGLASDWVTFRSTRLDLGSIFYQFVSVWVVFESLDY